MIEEGKPAPDFELATDTGERVKLSDFRGQPVVLYFYPKDDTPGCTVEACGFRDAYSEFEQRGAVVLGVSPDDEASHVKFKEKFSLPFTLLADPEHQVADQYGVWGEKKYAGKTWGELPGELRTKIIQEMAAPYGDDYARRIKLYFEQIADTAAKAKR